MRKLLIVMTFAITSCLGPSDYYNGVNNSEIAAEAKALNLQSGTVRYKIGDQEILEFMTDSFVELLIPGVNSTNFKIGVFESDPLRFLLDIHTSQDSLIELLLVMRLEINSSLDFWGFYNEDNDFNMGWSVENGVMKFIMKELPAKQSESMLVANKQVYLEFCLPVEPW